LPPALPMSLLVAGLVLFFGIHSISILADGWRNSTAARMGEGPWKGLFSLAAIAGFVLMAYGFGLARQDPVVLYSPAGWARFLAVILMIPVFPLLFAAYLPGRLKALAKHPMLLAIKFWALAHLLANGNLGDVLLFGSFLAWAVADRISLKRRVARPLPGPAPSLRNDLLAVIAGLAVYALFILWAHARLFGKPLA
jgi:uncharacterized membrane protein